MTFELQNIFEEEFPRIKDNCFKLLVMCQSFYVHHFAVVFEFLVIHIFTGVSLSQMVNTNYSKLFKPFLITRDEKSF